MSYRLIFILSSPIVKLYVILEKAYGKSNKKLTAEIGYWASSEPDVY